MLLNMQIQNRRTDKLTLSLNPKKPGFSCHRRNRSPSRNQVQVSTWRLSRTSFLFLELSGAASHWRILSAGQMEQSLSKFRDLKNAIQKHHSESVLCPSLERLYQDGVYYKSCPLERRNLFGIYQYVILNRRFGFWQFALRKTIVRLEVYIHEWATQPVAIDGWCLKWHRMCSGSLVTSRSEIIFAVPSISRKVPASSRMESPWRSVSCTTYAASKLIPYGHIKFFDTLIEWFTW